MFDLQEPCWICHKHIYSVLFWSEAIGSMNQIQAANREQALKLIQQKACRRGEQSRPVVFSDNNRWGGQQLFTISEFCFLIDQRRPAAVRDVPFSEVIGFEFQQEIALSTKVERTLSDANKRERERLRKLHDLLLSYREPAKYQQVINSFLDFKDPQFINSDRICFSSTHTANQILWVLPSFLSAGSYSYVVEYPRDKFYAHKALIFYREEALPVKSRMLEEGEQAKSPTKFFEEEESTPQQGTEGEGNSKKF